MKQFRFDSGLMNDFIKFGYDIYRDDPKWIPPIYEEVKNQLSPEYSFYNKPGNLLKHFLLYDKGAVCGRVTAMINKELKDNDKTPVGTIGFFECRKQYQYAQILLNAAIDWLRKNNIKKIWGPMNFDIWHSYRFKTVGFDADPFYGEPYNKSYYPEYFEKYGFSVKAEWDSVEINSCEILNQMKVKGEKRYNLLLKRGYRFELVDLRSLDNEIEKLKQIMSESFSNFLGFTPISTDELKSLFEKARWALHPRMFIFVYNGVNKLCGFAMAVRELADAIRVMKGQNNLIARMKFLYQRRLVNKINFYLGGITLEEMKNRSGLGRAGFYFIINEILKAGYDTMLLTLRLKGNLAHALPGQLSPTPQNEYTLYQVEL